MRFDSPYLSVTNIGTLSRVPFLAIKDKVLGKSYDLSVSFVTSTIARRINRERRGKDYIPNTLSFALSEKSGEIVMCAPEIRRQHTSFDMDFETFATYLLIHSMLHLKGYAHGSTMEAREEKLLRHFSATTTNNGKTTNNRRH